MAKQYDAPPPMTIDPASTYEAVIRTNEGDIVIDLLADEAPVTVNNFVFLARDGYYDGVTFHRVIEPFMIQGGDPTGTGAGGPGYRFADELPPKRPYGPGIVAMANAGPDTNGSQFFICTGPQSEGLNQYPNYTIFGQVKEGHDVLARLAAVPVGLSNSGEQSKPLADVYMESVTIRETPAK